MHGDGSASGGSLGIEEAELGVAFGQSVLVVEHGLEELINDVLAQILGSNESSLNGDAGNVGILTGVGAGRPSVVAFGVVMCAVMTTSTPAAIPASKGSISIAFISSQVL